MNNYLTSEDIKKLNEEIEYRKIVVRKKINEDLKEARAHGDLSENYEYKAAKRERAINESRMRHLDKIIKTAMIIKDNAAEDEVGLNKKVILKFIEDDDIEEFTLSTTLDADPVNNIISIESPLGKAIFKHKAGDEVAVNSPQGYYRVRIEKIKS